MQIKTILRKMQECAPHNFLSRHYKSSQINSELVKDKDNVKLM